MSRMAKPKKLPSAQIARWSRELQGNFGWLESNAQSISGANDFIDTCVSGVDYSSVRRGGSESSSTERAALSDRIDDHGQLAAVFMDKLEEARKLSYALRGLAVKLMVDWSDADKRAAAEMIARLSHEPAGSGRCANCTRTVSGSRIDRLKDGRCEACAAYWRRHGQTEERPKERWDPLQCITTWTNMAEHVEYQCVLRQGHEGSHQWEPIAA